MLVPCVLCRFIQRGGRKAKANQISDKAENASLPDIVTAIRECLQRPVDNIDEISYENETELLVQMLPISFIGIPKTIQKNLQEF